MNNYNPRLREMPINAKHFLFQITCACLIGQYHTLISYILGFGNGPNQTPTAKYVLHNEPVLLYIYTFFIRQCSCRNLLVILHHRSIAQTVCSSLGSSTQRLLRATPVCQQKAGHKQNPQTFSRKHQATANS